MAHHNEYLRPFCHILMIYWLPWDIHRDAGVILLFLQLSVLVELVLAVSRRFLLPRAIALWSLISDFAS